MNRNTPERRHKLKKRKLPPIKDVRCCEKDCLQKELSQEDMAVLRREYEDLPSKQ